MRYPIEAYDRYGYLKPTLWLWGGWFLLARSWVVFAVAGASRDSGADILQYVYPDHTALYIGLATSVPVVLTMWLINLRNGERLWLDRSIQYAKPVTLLVIVGQLVQTLHHIQLDHGAFSWTNAVTLVFLLWFALFVLKSRRVKTCFIAPKID